MSAFEFVTHLGAYPVVLAVGGATWLLAERDRGPWPVLVVLGAIGLASVLKVALGLPRPPGAGVGGYGFPSGHALGATVAWSLAAFRIDRGPEILRFAIAAGIVWAVAMSRVELGVHYPHQVTAGVGLGFVYLAAVQYYAGWWE